MSTSVAELSDAFGDHHHVFLLFARVFLELVFDALAVDADGRNRVLRVTQDADDFRREDAL